MKKIRFCTNRGESRLPYFLCTRRMWVYKINYCNRLSHIRSIVTKLRLIHWRYWQKKQVPSHDFRRTLYDFKIFTFDRCCPDLSRAFSIHMSAMRRMSCAAGLVAPQHQTLTFGASVFTLVLPSGVRQLTSCSESNKSTVSETACSCSFPRRLTHARFCDVSLTHCN